MISCVALVRSGVFIRFYLSRFGKDLDKASLWRRWRCSRAKTRPGLVSERPCPDGEGGIEQVKVMPRSIIVIISISTTLDIIVQYLETTRFVGFLYQTLFPPLKR